MESRTATRTEWIDSARGIGIVLVVAGHNPGLWSTAPELGRILFAFHMPLFFALVGTTLHGTPDLRRTVQRAAALGLAYLAMCLLSLPLAVRRPEHESLLQTLLGIVYGTGHTIVMTPLWFLPCLAATLFLVHAVERLRWSWSHRPSGAGDAAAAALLGLAGLAVLQLQGPLEPVLRLGWGRPHEAGWPLNLDLVPLAAAFVFFGRAIREVIEAGLRSESPYIYLALGAPLLFGVLYFVTEPRLDMNLRLAQPGLAALAVAALGTTTALMAAVLLQGTRTAAATAWLGQHTLLILWLHAGIEKRAWDGLAPLLPAMLAVIASIAIAVAVPFALDLTLKRTPRLRLLFYPQPWLARRMHAPRDAVAAAVAGAPPQALHPDEGHPRPS